jgi:hypothetical protein
MYFRVVLVWFLLDGCCELVQSLHDLGLRMCGSRRWQGWQGRHTRQCRSPRRFWWKTFGCALGWKVALPSCCTLILLPFALRTFASIAFVVALPNLESAFSGRFGPLMPIRIVLGRPRAFAITVRVSPTLVPLILLLLLRLGPVGRYEARVGVVPTGATMAAVVCRRLGRFPAVATLPRCFRHCFAN